MRPVISSRATLEYLLAGHVYNIDKYLTGLFYLLGHPVFQTHTLTHAYLTAIRYSKMFIVALDKRLGMTKKHYVFYFRVYGHPSTIRWSIKKLYTLLGALCLFRSLLLFKMEITTTRKTEQSRLNVNT